MKKTCENGDVSYAEIFEAEHGVVFVVDSTDCHFLRTSFNNCIKRFERGNFIKEEENV